MAQKITTTKVLRHHFALKNGGQRYIDIDNPIEDTNQIKTNIQTINANLTENQSGWYEGVLVGDAFFNGDSDAVVTSCTSAEIIETQKIVTTNTIEL